MAHSFVASELSRTAARGWRLWSRERHQRLARRLVICAAGALFLESAATIQLGYTLRLSQVLLCLALVIALPTWWGGFCLLPRNVRISAIFLVGAYALSTLLSDNRTISELSRGGSSRMPIYLADLIIGVGVMMLVVGLWDRQQPKSVLTAIAIGATIVACYSVYQWFALRFHLPGAHLNNAVDSNGGTFAASQGNGIFGWERVRGTFVEPHFLAAYLAGCLPITALTYTQLKSRANFLAIAPTLLVLSALVLTSSIPAWICIAAVLGATLFFILVCNPRNHSQRALNAILAIVVCCALTVVLYPNALGQLAGRSAQDLSLTSKFRFDSWSRAIDKWSFRPVVGYGPGQSSVQLAVANPGGTTSMVLGSAQGIWAAALVDAGVLGLIAWIAMFFSITVVLYRWLLKQPSFAALAATCAALIAIVTCLIAGDRLKLSAWLVLGLALAMSASSGHYGFEDNGETA